MKAYKGFNKDMTCRDFRFEEGGEYEEKEAKLCEAGFHACEDPIDCFGYYAPAQSVYREVDLEEVSDKRKDDSKIVGKRIKIGAVLDVAGICKVHFEYVKERCTNENNAEAGKPATAGDSGAASAGDHGAATAGSYGAASAGDRGAATAGYYGAATAGDHGAATAGDSGAATAGSYGAATAGSYGAATAGDSGAATSRGSAAVGNNGIACVRGNGVKAKGGLGAILVICAEREENYDVKEWKAAVVDGENILPDTWYTLKDGEFVACEETE